LGIALLASVSREGPAWAHFAPSATTVNRYLTITLVPGGITLAYTRLYGDQPGLAARRTMDANQDGTLSDAEADAFASSVAAETARTLDLEVDGQRQSPSPWSRVVCRPSPAVVVPAPVEVDLELDVTLTPGPHRVSVDDYTEVPNEGETEVFVDGGPTGATAVAHRSANATTGNDFLFPGPHDADPESRTVVIDTTVPGPPASPTTPTWPLWAAGGLLLVAAMGVWGIKRWRRATPPS
jgi:hypothetical protein